MCVTESVIKMWFYKSLSLHDQANKLVTSNYIAASGSYRSARFLWGTIPGRACLPVLPACDAAGTRINGAQPCATSLCAWITHWYKPNPDQAPEYMQGSLLEILAQKLVNKSGFPILLSSVWGWEPSSSCLSHSSFSCPQAMHGGEQDGCTQWETRIAITPLQGTRGLIVLLHWTELVFPYHAPEKKDLSRSLSSQQSKTPH